MFENTLRDFDDCLEAISDRKELSESEFECASEMLEKIKDFYEDYNLQHKDLQDKRQLVQILNHEEDEGDY